MKNNVVSSNRIEKILKSCGIAIGTTLVLMCLLSFLLKLFLPKSPEDNIYFLLFYIFVWLFSIGAGIYNGRLHWKNKKQ